MARMRTLKPEACTSETLAQVPREVRWTFGTFWTHCDDEGRSAWNLRLIKAAIYPLDDDVTITVLEREFGLLEAVGAVCRYEVEGREYVHIPSWPDHQHPNRKVESKLPPCPKTDHSTPTHVQHSEPAVSPPEHVTPVVVGEGRVEGDGVGRASRAAQKRGTRLSDDWRPSEDTRKWTLEHVTAQDAARELEKFRNHFVAKTGRDATKLDWDRTWRNWVLNSRCAAGRASPTESTADQRVNAGLALARELRAAEQGTSAKEISA